MKKFISKKSFIRNLLKRTMDGNESYEMVKEKIRAYGDEATRIKNWSSNTSDEVILSKLQHYLSLTESLLVELKKLPVVVDIEPLTTNRNYAEGLVRYLAYYPQKGRELQHIFTQIIFAHEKWLTNEINARNI